MNFSESESYLLSLGNEVSAMKLGLENIRTLLGELGDPEDNYLKVQVAGTNGKGSVCAFLDAICLAAGVKAGTFTSPHLVSITERIRISGADIGEADFALHATRVRSAAERLLAAGKLAYLPTFFEQVTAIALVAFAEAGVDLAILETGLGGRLDATTAANAEIAVITRIDLDHQEYLGGTIEEIAAEKAAIIRPGCMAFVGEQPSGATSVILQRCKDVGVEPDFADFVDARESDGRLRVTTAATDYEINGIGLAGRHQIENAKLAVLVGEELARRFPMLKSHIPQGIERARHPGRIEYQGDFLFDGAHNVSGAKVLAEFLAEFEQRPITLVFGVMQGKDVAGMSELLFPLAEAIVITRPRNSRALDVAEVLRLAPREHWRDKVIVPEPDVRKALASARRISREGHVIVVTGSLYLVGEAKQILGSQI